MSRLKTLLMRDPNLHSILDRICGRRRDRIWGNSSMKRILIAAMLAASPALAHDHARPELNGWFESLRSAKGGPCCDGSDAKRIDDVDWETRDGHYRVRLDGQWVDVPDGAVVEGPNREGPAMVWPYYLNGKLDGIRCFMPGSGA